MASPVSASLPLTVPSAAKIIFCLKPEIVTVAVTGVLTDQISAPASRLVFVTESVEL